MRHIWILEVAEQMNWRAGGWSKNESHWDSASRGVCRDLCVVSGLPVLYEQHRPVEPSKRRARSRWLACEKGDAVFATPAYREGRWVEADSVKYRKGKLSPTEHCALLVPAIISAFSGFVFLFKWDNTAWPVFITCSNNIKYIWKLVP